MSAAGLHLWERGEGEPAVLCVHESGATSAVWRALARALAPRARVLAYDRRGWGRTSPPEGYTRTTVGEQAAEAAALLEHRVGAPAVLCGAGIGAVIALELVTRRPELASGAVLVEPPLLAFLTDATEQLSADVKAIREATVDGGRHGVYELYASGGLPALGAGAERLAQAGCAAGPGAVSVLLAELGAVPAWQLPLAELVRVPRPMVIAIGAQTPSLLVRAAEALASALPGSDLRRLEAPGLPHHGGAVELADLILELLPARQA